MIQPSHPKPKQDQLDGHGPEESGTTPPTLTDQRVQGGESEQLQSSWMTISMMIYPGQRTWHSWVRKHESGSTSWKSPEVLRNFYRCTLKPCWALLCGFGNCTAGDQDSYCKEITGTDSCQCKTSTTVAMGSQCLQESLSPSPVTVHTYQIW